MRSHGLPPVTFHRAASGDQFTFGSGRNLRARRGKASTGIDSDKDFFQLALGVIDIIPRGRGQQQSWQVSVATAGVYGVTGMEAAPGL